MMHDPFTTERNSLAIDDLVVGKSYEFITPNGHVYRGTWLGVDGRMAAVEFPPGAIDLFPHGVVFHYPQRSWAACIITAMEPAKHDELPPAPQSDLAVLRATWPIVAGCILVWGVGILYLICRVFLR